MKLKTGLKKKKKLLGLAMTEYNRLYRYNSVRLGNENNRPYSPTESLNNWIQLTDDLIELKRRIHQTNLPVLDKIFRIAELKGMVSNLQDISCDSGEDVRRDDKVYMVSEVTVRMRDELISKWQEEIEKIQEELDDFNHKTELAA